ncbi:MAG: hypothetical protein AAB579_04255, partial [Patescibacteria group bacterium]
KRVVLCTGDRDFIPLIASLHEKGVIVGLISIPDPFVEENPHGISRSLRDVVEDKHIHPIGHSAEHQLPTEIGTTSYSDMSLDDLLGKTDNAIGELIESLLAVIKNTATVKQRFTESQLVHTVWRGVMLKFIAAGLTKTIVREMVTRLQRADEIAKWNGHLYTMVEEIGTDPYLVWKPLTLAST